MLNLFSRNEKTLYKRIVVVFGYGDRTNRETLKNRLREVHIYRGYNIDLIESVDEKDCTLFEVSSYNKNVMDALLSLRSREIGLVG